MVHFSLERDLFNIKRLTDIRECLRRDLQLANALLWVLRATFSQRSSWWIDETVFKKLKPNINCQYVTTYLEEV